MSQKPENANRRQNALLVDASRCIGCFSCGVACKMEHDLPPGPHPIKVIQVGPLVHGNGLSMTYMAVTCLHCERPACVLACPTEAMQKRADGVVFSDPEKCIGCQTCAIACPFGVPQLNPATGKIAKCDGCMQRVDKGLWPACALICPTGTLIFGRSKRVIQDMRQKEALKALKALKLDV